MGCWFPRNKKKLYLKITVSLIFLKERKRQTDRKTHRQKDRQRDKGRGRHKESLPRTDRYQDIKTHRRTAKQKGEVRMSFPCIKTLKKNKLTRLFEIIQIFSNKITAFLSKLKMS